MNTESRTLVVDASVARAASGPNAASKGVGAVSRDFLQEMLTICHKVAMSKQIAEEWGRHQSIFSRNWRASMVARKKLIPIRVTEDTALRARVESSLLSVSERTAAVKDCHLVEAALASEKRIVSLDNSAKMLFKAAAGHVAELRGIAWITPTDTASIAWLKAGAPLDDSITL